MKPIENLRADVKDILETGRRIVNRHISSIRGFVGGFRLRR
ncbi:MAG: hypothetical protein ACTSPB_15650 [Candidatus Thorarchaeota archaeon]